ncbi:MAG: amidohydrolase family protein, partial [Candidatus Omnitrophota bacterium]
VLFHSGDELAPQMVIRATPRRLLNVRKRFPGLTIIAAHLGGFRQWDEVKSALLGTDIYLDTSATFGYLPDDDIKYILEHHRRDRILFGTDFPFVNQKKDLDHLDKLGLENKQKEMILSSNAREILHI